MKFKTLITVILLLFVGASIIYLVFGLSRPDQPAGELRKHEIIEPAHYDGSPDSVSEKSEEPDHRVVAYYFHATRRCVTCRTIEAFTEESLQDGFPRELETGRLAWQSVNFDTPENEHFIDDYQLTTGSVVLVKLQDGEQKQWKNLTRVWELVRDKASFFTYIQEETGQFLGE